MKYEGRIYRPPSEGKSLIIQVTVGCSHNRCAFCSMYKDKQFKMRALEDVFADLGAARAQYPHIGRIFLADGDALICPAERLEKVLRYIGRTIPECKRVAIYGSPRSVLSKTPKELKELADLGLGIVYMGVESGCDTVLWRMDKGETAEEIVKAGQMVKEAGIQLSVTAISGLGGIDMWEEHAVQTAKALSEMKPDYIGLLTLMLEDGAPLVRDYQLGKFLLLTPEQIARETMLLLQNIDSEGSVFRSNHASNYLSLAGTLNRDIPEMLQVLGAALEGGLHFRSEGWRVL